MDTLVSLFEIEGFSEVFGVLCAVFILIGAWLPRRRTKLLPTLVAVTSVAVGQELFRLLYFRSVEQPYVRSPVVTAITIAIAIVMMGAGYFITSRNNNDQNELVVSGEVAHVIKSIAHGENGFVKAKGTEAEEGPASHKIVKESRVYQ